jgi:hypothetical protein
VVSKRRAMDARWRLLPPFISITTSEKGKALDDLSQAPPIGADQGLSSRIGRNWSLLPGIRAQAPVMVCGIA